MLYWKLNCHRNHNGNDFIVLLKIGLSRFINKLTLRRNLNLLQSVAKMLKLSKLMAKLSKLMA